MRDQYAGQPGTFLVDPEAGIRLPAEDWELYQFNKQAYLADPAQARVSYEKVLVKNESKTAKGESDAKLS